jgi:hypothetical protein
MLAATLLETINFLAAEGHDRKTTHKAICDYLRASLLVTSDHVEKKREARGFQCD